MNEERIIAFIGLQASLILTALVMYNSDSTYAIMLWLLITEYGFILL